MIKSIMEQRNVVKDLDKNLMGEPFKPKSRDEVMQHLNAIRTEHENEQKQATKEVSKAENEKYNEKLCDILMCPLTLAIFIDPGKLYHQLCRFKS
jgi:hypothetical protein